MAEELFEQSNLCCLMSFVDALARSHSSQINEYGFRIRDLEEKVQLCEAQMAVLRKDISSREEKIEKIITVSKNIKVNENTDIQTAGMYEKFEFDSDNKRSELNLINNLYDYLKRLKEDEDKYIVLIATSEYSTRYINSDIRKAIRDLGLNYRFDEDYVPYVAILVKGHLLRENKKTRGNSIENIDVVRGNTLYLSSISGSFSYCTININNHNYDVNKNGINFVILNAINSKIIDSVAFDTDKAGCPAVRK